MMVISSRETSDVPEAEKLRKAAQAIAMLDAIIMPEWQWRYYTFQINWGDQIDLFSMRNGEGDEFFIVFQPWGVLIKGFAHESRLNPYRTDPPSVLPCLLDGLPSSFQPLLREPAFVFDEITFCLWRETHDSHWRHGDLSKLPVGISDRSEDMMFILDGNPATYHDWAKNYYGRSLPLESISAIYQHMPLSEPLIQQLNAETTLSHAQDEAIGIGYSL
jgi:hypothetical protein